MLRRPPAGSLERMTEPPSIRLPGVFVREIPLRPGTIEFGRSDVAGFVGFTATAPADGVGDLDGAQVQAVASQSEFESLFGGPAEDSVLPHAVEGFFNNGGRRAYIAHIAEPAQPAPAYTGVEAAARAVDSLLAVDEVSVLAFPDLVNVVGTGDGGVDGSMWRAMQVAMIAKCEERGDVMAILDPPPAMSAGEVAAWRQTASYDSSYAALFYPWLEVADGGTTTRLVPPSGHVAGIWARTEVARGVWKAPANEAVTGVLGLSAAVSDADQEVLNPLGINAIRTFPSRGMVLWGARTLSSDASWKFINVRRLLSAIERAITGAVRARGSEPLATLILQAENLLTGLWRQGAFQGARAEEAFFVRSLSTTGDGDLQVGVAPLRPAEFVVVRIAVR